ncbi:hypothetical protein [Micromonospora sp. RTP1Z1]|uniref:GAF domain-containing protein n=1 Tax=Micromonospora sp. RTP1Z1 TaxID=2994043 RepID=UPI0029C9399C|nr:hypothetical protein [Micromonospora sp. RTP1Z1]
MRLRSDTPADGTFTNVAWLAATTFGTPIATLSIVDRDRVWFAATHGLDGVAEVGVDPGLCASVVKQDGPYVVTDAAVDPAVSSAGTRPAPPSRS